MFILKQNNINVESSWFSLTPSASLSLVPWGNAGTDQLKQFFVGHVVYFVTKGNRKISLGSWGTCLLCFLPQPPSPPVPSSSLSFSFSLSLNVMWWRIINRLKSYGQPFCNHEGNQLKDNVKFRKQSKNQGGKKKHIFSVIVELLDHSSLTNQSQIELFQLQDLTNLFSC